MVNEFVLNQALRKYLAKARWWPWKGSSVDVEIASIEETERIVFLLIKAGESLFQLPLMKAHEVPRELTSRGFCIESESECYVEAEYTKDYLAEFSKLEKSRYIELHTSLNDIIVQRSRPLTLESTNVIAIYESTAGTIVLKSYRLLPDTNIEAKILEQLTKWRYRHIPKVHGILHYGDYISSILMNYVKGLGDGGTPFYKSLREYLLGRRDSYEINLASKIGVIIGEMHLALNAGLVDSFFGAEDISFGDILMWSTRMEKMYREGLKRLDEVILTLENKEREELDHWRSIADQVEVIIHGAINYLERYAHDLYKARTHQDLHLSQMIYLGDGVTDFVITDFEGEPGRNREERLVKEPLLRDVASMIRSYHYLSHASLMNSYNMSRHQASVVMMSNDPTFDWRMRHVSAMVNSYMARVRGSKMLGIDEDKISENPWMYLYPWIVERAVYELYYESFYRPEWTSIPIAGLLEAEKYLLFSS